MATQDPIIVRLTQIIDNPKEPLPRRVQAMMEQMKHLITNLPPVRPTDPRATGAEQST